MKNIDKEAPIRKVISFRNIGEEFRYLGVNFVVASHFKAIIGGKKNEGFPALVARYKNEIGDIKEITFLPHEIDALERMSLSTHGESMVVIKDWKQFCHCCGVCSEYPCDGALNGGDCIKAKCVCNEQD